MKRFISIALLTASTAASANYYTGNDLLEHMNKRESANEMLVLGYVAGVSDFARGDYALRPFERDARPEAGCCSPAFVA